MKIATILPFAHLALERFNDYHMALAHLIDACPEYEKFFRAASDRGNFVIIDNGVVERGNPMGVAELLSRAWRIKASEVILPDRIGDAYATCRNGKKSLEQVGDLCQTMAVPQGRTLSEWRDCLKVMLDWPVQTIGISRFTRAFVPDRATLLMQAPELVQSSKDIHLLGCAGDPVEAWNIEVQWPGRVRGIDSGIAAICAQEGLLLEPGTIKPAVELNFHAKHLDGNLLRTNVLWWRHRCSGVEVGR
jgi:hypothetical protein